jgi:hypothetical protein
LKRFFTTILAVLAIALTTACTRIETGEVGLRLNASKQIEGSELTEGTWNQTFIGNVLTFPVRDVAMQLQNHRPSTVENTQLSDLDFTVIYNINPSAVSELWSKKSRSFHYYSEDSKDWVLMYNYMWTVASNAAVKTIRKYEALKVVDAREKIEAEIAEAVKAELKKEGLETSLTLSSVRVQNILPNQSIVDAATATIRAQQQVAVAEAQVQVAKKEAERMKELAANAGQSIEYMNAQSLAMIAQGVRDGKVTTIVVPYDFKGIVNVGK